MGPNAKLAAYHGGGKLPQSTILFLVGIKADSGYGFCIALGLLRSNSFRGVERSID